MDHKEFNEFRKLLGQRVQELRKQQNITQEELGARTSLDRVSVGYIEQGIRTPKLSTLLLLSKALRISLKDFFEPFA